MNKEYIYIDGKVIISDENGHQKQNEYYDNLGKVLVQENVIEEIERKIQQLTEKSKRFKVERFTPITLIEIVGTASLAPFILWGVTGVNTFINQTDTIIGTMNQAALIIITMTTALIPIGFLLNNKYYIEYKDYIRKEKAINSELNFLYSQLEKEKENLINLEKEKTRNNEDIETNSKIVDDIEQLKELKRLLEIYYDLGYNSEEYYRYYQQGILEEKLKGYYSDSEIGLIKNYLEEKSPVPVLKKKETIVNNYNKMKLKK